MTKIKRPLADLLPVAEKLADELRPFCERIEIAGSLRRRVAEVGDIELVAIPQMDLVNVGTGEMNLFTGQPETKSTQINRLWAHLESNPRIDWKKRGQKYRQFLLHGTQIDLFTAKPGNWGWIYLIRTGSAKFSHHVAGQLNAKGYTSREGWIEPKVGCRGRRQTPKEEDVFQLAGMKVVDPVMR